MMPWVMFFYCNLQMIHTSLHLRLVWEVYYNIAAVWHVTCIFTVGPFSSDTLLLNRDKSTVGEARSFSTTVASIDQNAMRPHPQSMTDQIWYTDERSLCSLLYAQTQHFSTICLKLLTKGILGSKIVQQADWDKVGTPNCYSSFISISIGDPKTQ